MNQSGSTSLRIGWGFKIALLYIGFVVMIASLVIATCFHRSELVTEDYYQRELTYQQQLDAAHAAAALPAPLRISSGSRFFVLHFPAVLSGKVQEATVHFYAPAQAAADRSFTVPVTADSAVIDRTQLQRVPYEAQVSWQAGGKKYYQSINLPVQHP